MLTWNDISAYVEQGKTNEEIHTLLTANRQYKRAIYATGGNQAWSVLSLLTMKYGVLSMNDKQEWIGSLIDLAATTPAVDTMLSKLRPYLQINDAKIDCTNNDVGTLVYGLCATLASLLNSNVPFDDINDLSGGLRYAGITVEHIANVREAALLDNALISVQVKNAAAYEAAATVKRANGATVSAILEAARAVWDAE
jgi:hypothetical protein